MLHKMKNFDVMIVHYEVITKASRDDHECVHKIQLLYKE